MGYAIYVMMYNILGVNDKLAQSGEFEVGLIHLVLREFSMDALSHIGFENQYM